MNWGKCYSSGVPHRLPSCTDISFLKFAVVTELLSTRSEEADEGHSVRQGGLIEQSGHLSTMLSLIRDIALVLNGSVLISPVHSTEFNELIFAADHLPNFAGLLVKQERVRM